MEGNIAFQLSSSVLEWARNSRGFSVDEAAKKAGVSSDKYLLWEKGLIKPTYKQLEKLAENVYKRPLAILLSKNPPAEEPIQSDFRSLSNKEVNDLSPDLRLAVRKAKRYQTILNDINGEKKLKFKEFEVSLNDNPSSSSIKFRSFLGLTIEEQKSWNGDNSFNSFKNLVESIGIYVFHLKISIHDARAFCLTGNNPIIVLNSEDSRNGKIFSLFHEVCHIFFNSNSIFKDASSGELKKEYKEIEDFCNFFAAAFLVPDAHFENDIKNNLGAWDKNSIQRFAVAYNVSSEVIARKLLYRKLLSSTTFWAYKRDWDSYAQSAKEREKEKLKQQETKGIKQDIKIIYEKGKPYVSDVISAYQNGRISSSDLSNFLEAKIDHLPALIERITNIKN